MCGESGKDVSELLIRAPSECGEPYPESGAAARALGSTGAVKSSVKRHPWRYRLVVLLLALAVRLIALQIWPASTGNDASEHLSLGYHISHSNSFSFGATHKWGADAPFTASSEKQFSRPTAARAPLYPLLIAALWKLDPNGGPPLIAIRGLQAVMGAVTAVLILEVGSTAFGVTVGGLAALAFCFAPLSVQTVTQILSESLFTLLELTAIYFWTSQRPTLAGVAFGFAILGRAILLPFMIVILISYFFRRSRSLLIVPISALLVVLPWSIRNLSVIGKPILVNTEGWGSTLLQGTLFVPYGSGNPFIAYSNDPAARDSINNTNDESEAEQKMFSYAVNRIDDRPLHWLINRILQYPRLFLDPGTYVMSLMQDRRWNVIIELLFVSGNALLTAAAGIGAWKARKNRQSHPLLSTMVFLAVISFTAVTQVRYSLPMTPGLLMFAAVALVGAPGSRLQKRTSL